MQSGNGKLSINNKEIIEGTRKLEEYILKRKTEDGINEFERNKRVENTRICVNYIFEYFNNHPETTAGEERVFGEAFIRESNHVNN